ncbi:hypothetical protein IV86_GL001206 [Pediococcus pentosaceus]|nr:hypothetical protein IV86_GL001206 [Pediococcus pentosaceus]CCG89568.1 hypothetical protein PCPN_152 [Pediococcus pentosaceus IE-3]
MELLLDLSSDEFLSSKLLLLSLFITFEERTGAPSEVLVALLTITFVALKAMTMVTIAIGVKKGGVLYAISLSLRL